GKCCLFCLLWLWFCPLLHLLSLRIKIVVILKPGKKHNGFMRKTAVPLKIRTGLIATATGWPVRTSRGSTRIISLDLLWETNLRNKKIPQIRHALKWFGSLMVTPSKPHCQTAKQKMSASSSLTLQKPSIRKKESSLAGRRPQPSQSGCSLPERTSSWNLTRTKG